MSDCCVKGFEWNGTPIGNDTGKLANNNTYITGSNPDVAILVIADLFGWTFRNIRLLADHYAKEGDATVYVPDFFDGEVIPSKILLSDPSQWHDLGFDRPSFISRNTKAIRRPEIFECAKALRAQYKRVGAIGYCYGGWSTFQLGAKGNNLVDCISSAHPTWLEKSEIDNIGVPVQIIAPEFDPTYTAELKEHSNKVIPTLGIPYQYCFYPGVEHAFCTRGDPSNEAELKAMVRAKNEAVQWCRQWLHK